MNTTTPTPWGEIGYITFKRSYARRISEDTNDTRTEELHDVVMREIEASDRQLKVGFTASEKDYYYKSRMGLKWSVAGRFMWQLNTDTVDRLGLASLQNCAGVLIDSPIEPFTWAFDMLMLGCGVGFSVQRRHMDKLPNVGQAVTITRQDDDEADFIVSDTREGWIELLERVLKAHFFTGEGFTYSTHRVRPLGAPIRGFGGTASGPEPLVEGITLIHALLNGRAGLRLRSIDGLDIMNIIGQIVVSGNVRRSAELAIGDHDDEDFLMAKRWDLGPIPNWRSMSNNSIELPEDFDSIPQLFWDTYQQGEPYGIINMMMTREVGRTGDTRYPDAKVFVYNPCVEQPLADRETCCLGMVFLPMIASYGELLEVLTYVYRMCKHSLALKCHQKSTEEIVHTFMRMGIGMPGYLQASEEQRSWLPAAYEFLRAYDRMYSRLHGFPESIKLTTSKPDGTMALLPAVTPGGNPNPAGPYYIRRIRMSAVSPLVEVCRKHGYHVEYQKKLDGSDDYTTVVVSFPCKVPETTPVAATYTWRQQMDTIRRIQRDWSDNSVSCTITYRKEDLPEIKAYLRKHMRHEIKAISFLLYEDHGFIQAPYETITKEQYEEMVRSTRPIASLNADLENITLVQECENGACPIK